MRGGWKYLGEQDLGALSASSGVAGLRGSAHLQQRRVLWAAARGQPRERWASASAEHKDLTLETQRLGGSGKIGSCDNTFEMTPSPRHRSVFYHNRKVSHCPSIQTLAEGGQPRGGVPASMPWRMLANPPECPFFIFLPIGSQLFS